MSEEVMQSNLLELEEFDEEKMKAESADLLELRYLTKENAKFERTPGGFVKLTYKDKTYDRVGVYRTFPVTMPEEFISIREADEKAREIGVVEKLSELSPEQAASVAELTGGDSLASNIRLVFNNAKVAAQTAVAYCEN